MTNLEKLKEVVDIDPVRVVRRMWDCFACPKLRECSLDKGWDDPEKCKKHIEAWLAEEYAPTKK